MLLPKPPLQPVSIPASSTFTLSLAYADTVKVFTPPTNRYCVVVMMKMCCGYYSTLIAATLCYDTETWCLGMSDTIVLNVTV